VLGVASLPQTLNPYVYAVNNPVNLVDPMGLTGQPPGGFGIAKYGISWAKMGVDYGRWVLAAMTTSPTSSSALEAGWSYLVDMLGATSGLGAFPSAPGRAATETLKGIARVRGFQHTQLAVPARPVAQLSRHAGLGAGLRTVSKALGAVGSALTLSQGLYEGYQLYTGTTLPCLKGADALITYRGLSAYFKMAAGVAGLGMLLPGAQPIALAGLICFTAASTVVDIGLSKGWFSD